MDRYTRITKEALKYLSYMIASCTPLCRPKQRENEHYVIKMAREGRDVTFSRFVNGLPQKDLDLYKKLYEFKQKQGEIYINVETLCRFFGGQEHIEKALSDVEKINLPDSLSEERKKRIKSFFTFIHVLCPIRVEEFDGRRCSGVYENEKGGKEIKVRIKNLMTFRRIRNHIKPGRIAYFHYASIICVPSGKFNAKVTEEILLEQAGSPGFMEAAQYLSRSGIDFDKTSELRTAAEETAEEYDL